MFITDFCSSNDSPHKRKLNYQNKKLELLKLYKDSLERRIAAINASIEVLEQQINKHNEQENE